jgi:hypothetical protein
MWTARHISPFVNEEGLRYWKSLKTDALSDILPNSKFAIDALSKLKKKGSNGRLAPVGGAVDRPNFLDEITNAEKKRWRFAHSYGIKMPEYGPRWGRSFSLYLELLPKSVMYSGSVVHVKREVLRVLEDIYAFQQGNSDALYDLLRNLTEIAKKNGDLLFHGFWMYLVNLETFGGFLDAKEIEDFAQDLEDWVTGDIIHTMPTPDGPSEDYFLEVMEEGLEDFLDGAPSVARANERALSISEWSRDRSNWAVNGTSSHPEKRVNYTIPGNDHVYKTKKSKWSTALTMTDNDVERILRATTSSSLQGKAKAIQKRETGKVRAIVSSDDELYIRMTYISHWLETAFIGDERSTLFMSSEQLTNMWLRLSESLGTNVRIPLDQSHFDWQQNKRMFSVFFRVLRNYISRYSSGIVQKDLLTVLDGVRRSLVEIPAYLKFSNFKIMIEKGVLSGWRWTAFIDTAFNYAEFHCARRVLSDLGVQGLLYSLVAQGDDDQVSVSSYGYAAGLTLAYTLMNFEINPGKFFVDMTRDEYLRQVVQDNRVCGYPARGINAILWRGPETRDPPAGELRFNETVTYWMTLINRGMDRNACSKLLLRDLSQGNGLTLADAYNLLHTPSVYGGAGLYPYTSDWVIPIQPVFNQKYRIVSSLIGVESEIRKIEESGVYLEKNEVHEALSPNLEFSKATKVTVEPFHIKRISGDLSPLFIAGSLGGHFPTRCPRQDQWLNGVLSEQVLRNRIRARDWEWIRRKWVREDFLNVSNSFESRGGRRVWIAWLTGKLPGGLPVVEGYSALVTSVTYNQLYSTSLLVVSNMSRFSWSILEKMALGVELKTREFLLKMGTTIGG